MTHTTALIPLFCPLLYEGIYAQSSLGQLSESHWKAIQD